MTQVPVDVYTPFGYLTFADHSARVAPRGVLRTAGTGFRWHLPSFVGGYGGRAEVADVGLTVDAVAQHSERHTANVFGFTAEDLTITCFTVGPEAWVMRIDGPAGRRVGVRFDYARVLGARGQWGESGLVRRDEAEALVLQAFEDGDAFACAGPVQWEAGSGEPALGGKGERVSLEATGTVQLGEGPVTLAVGRGSVRARAMRAATAALETADAQLAAHDRADESFWATAPRLTGDWPEHWRRGLVYDLETLRMMVKPPMGDYGHTWDAMQIQAPRTVLAEAAMDALALSWGDPAAAQAMLAGVIANADQPQVPCSREDGTYNMVSAEGEECGTGPQWGYPVLVFQRLAALSEWNDQLATMREGLRRLVEWWWVHRKRGHLAFSCSWESGQDESPRFGDHPWGGGTPTWGVEPVDLLASLAHACAVLADVGPADGWRPPEGLLDECVAGLARLRGEGRYLDHIDGRPSEVVDVMQLAPWALGVHPAGDPLLPDLSDAYGPAVWPMFAWTYVLAAEATGAARSGIELAATTIDRAYGYWDRRDYTPPETMPGIACEYWPMTPRCGGEGYGWGAFTAELLLSHALGIRVLADGGFELRVDLPERFTEGTYGAEFSVSGRRHRVAITVVADGFLLDVDGRESRVARGEVHRVE